MCMSPTTTIHTYIYIYISEIVQRGETKLANISDYKGDPIKFVLARNSSLWTPRHVSFFDGGQRCTLEIIMSYDLERLVANVDD